MVRCLSALTARMWLFYLKNLLQERGKLSFNVIREIGSYLADRFLLAQVTSTALELFNTSALCWGPHVLHTPIEVYQDSRWVMLEDGRLFCSGGRSTQTDNQALKMLSKAYLLSRDGTVEMLPDMLIARYNHGVIEVLLRIYVFGGGERKGVYAIIKNIVQFQQCEKIDLSMHNRKWQPLPDMKEGRWAFNPCLFNEYVYVCGYGSRLVETFSPQTDRFLSLRVEVPENTACCLLVHNNLLVIHSENYISRFTAAQTGQLFQQTQVRCRYSGRYSNSQPVVDSARGLYLIIWLGVAYSINLETGALLQLT